jgi:hypothetical protein
MNLICIRLAALLAIESSIPAEQELQRLTATRIHQLEGAVAVYREKHGRYPKSLSEATAEAFPGESADRLRDGWGRPIRYYWSL